MDGKNEYAQNKDTNHRLVTMKFPLRQKLAQCKLLVTFPIYCSNYNED